MDVFPSSPKVNINLGNFSEKMSPKPFKNRPSGAIGTYLVALRRQKGLSLNRGLTQLPHAAQAVLLTDMTIL